MYTYALQQHKMYSWIKEKAYINDEMILSFLPMWLGHNPHLLPVFSWLKTLCPPWLKTHTKKKFYQQDSVCNITTLNCLTCKNVYDYLQCFGTSQSSKWLMIKKKRSILESSGSLKTSHWFSGITAVFSFLLQTQSKGNQNKRTIFTSITLDSGMSKQQIKLNSRRQAH